MKKCSVCLIDKDLNAFDESKKGNGCYRKTCRKCRNQKNTKSYLDKEGNLEKRREYMKEYQKKHRDENDYYKLYCQCLWSLKSKVKSKKNNDVKVYLESLFTPEMSWLNYGSYWEIDHIVSATKMARAGYSIDEINKPSNLRPMIIIENRERSKLL